MHAKCNQRVPGPGYGKLRQNPDCRSKFILSKPGRPGECQMHFETLAKGTLCHVDSDGR